MNKLKKNLINHKIVDLIILSIITYIVSGIVWTFIFKDGTCFATFNLMFSWKANITAAISCSLIYFLLFKKPVKISFFFLYGLFYALVYILHIVSLILFIPIFPVGYAFILAGLFGSDSGLGNTLYTSIPMRFVAASVFPALVYIIINLITVVKNMENRFYKLFIYYISVALLTAIIFPYFAATTLNLISKFTK